MSAMLGTFHFLRPWWLLGLVALPVLWRAFSMISSDAGSWRGAVDAHLLQHLLVGGNDTTPSRWPRWLALAAWLLLCLALAGPAWEQLPQPLYQNRTARVFLLELSASMLAQDVKPSRYERARFKLDDMLGRSGDLQTALIAYAGDAFVVAPLTDDANTVLNLVDALDPSVMPAPGNATGRAIDAGLQLIKQAGAPRAEIIVLADGIGDDALPAAGRARATGVRVIVLGIGSSGGAPVPLPQGFLKNASGEIVLPKLDEQALAALADAGGGRYVPYTPDAADVNALLAEGVFAASADTAQATQATTARYLDRGPWLVLLLLPLAALGFRRGWLMFVPLCAALHVQSAQAFSWADLWQRADQQARTELDAGHAQQAQQLARAPELRGSAAYRAGDFENAAKDFSQRENADAHYNRGNALAKQGHYPEAIAAYDAALKAAPDMDDAAANKRSVEEWLKQQQQQKQASQQNAKDHQGHEQQQDGSGSSSEQSAQQDKDKQQGTQNEQSQQDQASGQDGKPGENHQQQDQGTAQDNAQQAAGGEQGKDEKSEQQSANAQQSAQQAQEQFRQSMDQAVKNEGKDGDKKAQAVRLGANSEGKTKDEHQQAVEQLIERVPDDPGGLLRRKFQLEYQRRQNRGGGPQ